MRDILESEYSQLEDFQLVEAADLPELIDAGATDAVTTSYERADGTSVSLDLAAFSSPDDAVGFLEADVNALIDAGYTVSSETTVTDEQGGETLGPAVSLTGEGGKTVVLWTNRQLFVATYGPGEAPVDLYNAAPF